MIERGVTISAGIESLTKKGKFRMSYCMGKGKGEGELSLSRTLHFRNMYIIFFFVCGAFTSHGRWHHRDHYHRAWRGTRGRAGGAKSRNLLDVSFVSTINSGGLGHTSPLLPLYSKFDQYHKLPF